MCGVRRSVLLAAVLTAALCSVTAATAQQAAPRKMTPSAREHLERGLRYFDTQEYGAAIAEFKAGYQAEPHPDFLYALAQAQRLSGNCRDAASAYRSFLRAGPPREEADLARQNLEKCEAVLGEESAPPAPTASATDTPKPPPLQPTALPSAPPKQPPSPPPQEGTAPAPFYTDVLGDVLCGVGVVGLLVGGSLWGVALERASSADEGTFEEYEADADAATDLRAGAVVAAALGTGFFAAGIIRFATRPAPRSKTTGVAVRLGPAGVAMRGAF